MAIRGLRGTRPRRRAGATAALTVLGLLVGVGAPTWPGVVQREGQVASRASLPEPARSARPPSRRPNILLITSDDQTDEELRWMPLTRRLIARQGVRATDFISPHPLCCPARAEILTGEYAQNNGVRHNFGWYGGWQAFLRAHDDHHQIGLWLHRTGYRTAFVGKMLNGYEGDPRRMPGFDHWNPTIAGTYAYYGTTFANDGHPRSFPHDYVADVAARYARRYLRQFSRGRAPWFLWISDVGPHTSETSLGTGPPIPAARHAGLFRHVRPPSLRRPSWNEAAIGDKPRPVAGQHRKARRAVVRLFRARLRTLQAIDEANARLIRQLRRSGELEDTVVVYASDNGFQLGEHRLLGKNFPYEESLQVPFLIRGPGLPTGTRTRRPMGMVDLPATVLDLAGVLKRLRLHGQTDGRSMWRRLTGAGDGPDTQLIQAGTDNRKILRRHGWWWRGVRTRRWTYVHWWYGANELYDRVNDPFETQNLAGHRGYRATQVELRRRLDVLSHCHGADQCVRDFGPVPVRADRTR